ncbi:uncharacterized protein LOC27206541 [Drosophila simulans]|uniref:GD23298 n=1 Tax=Drosophila simulans TaxID=7240 RepID=B4Q325_DROSI|nr:uncharacterized protein LOC27206541 [Drosophila simulans]EDX03741.1 GD23298 [Drosophila simulans]KMY88116.1 uncharacterized protein Dsimw501_GD23298 [Drosophila simulans]
MNFKACSSKSSVSPPKRIGISLEDPVSSCDEFPRPLGPMLKYIALSPNFEIARRKSPLKRANVPRASQARKSGNKNKMHLAKAPIYGRKRPAGKVTNRRDVTTRKPRKPKGTKIIGGEKPVESNSRPWWKFFFSKKQNDEETLREAQQDNISCDVLMTDMATQTNVMGSPQWDNSDYLHH